MSSRLSPGKLGAVGLSRRSSLMDKPLEFTSLHDLVSNYRSAGCSGTCSPLPTGRPTRPAATPCSRCARPSEKPTTLPPRCGWGS
jgi:hypothetical protein